MAQELATQPPPGWLSPFIGAGALPLVAALGGSIDPAFRSLLSAAVRRWRSTLQSPVGSDVMLGAAGALLGAAEIESYAPGVIPRDFLNALHHISGSYLKKLLKSSARQPVYLGLAHGLTGQLFALEAGRAAFGLKLSSNLRDSVLEIVTTSRIIGPRQSAMWPNCTTETTFGIHGWCHGAPGIGLALLGAYALSGDDSYRKCTIWALNGTHRYRVGPAFFCCGAAGRAQVLIEAYRLTGSPVWLRLARRVSRQLPSTLSGRTHIRGFHRGRLGLDYVGWRLIDPLRLPLPGLGALSLAEPPAGAVRRALRRVKPA